jgi:hypothetical protein
VCADCGQRPGVSPGLPGGRRLRGDRSGPSRPRPVRVSAALP